MTFHWPGPCRDRPGGRANVSHTADVSRVLVHRGRTAVIHQRRWRPGTLTASGFPRTTAARPYTPSTRRPLLQPPEPCDRSLSAIDRGEPRAAKELFPLVYDELRQLAAAKLAREPAGHTLQATALVHEAYLRLIEGDPEQEFNGRGHFFAAAAEAMRRILVDMARRKKADKRGGGRGRLDLDTVGPVAADRVDDLLALDEALSLLATADAQAAQLVIPLFRRADHQRKPRPSRCVARTADSL